jgi:hypothetical protein
MNIFSTIMRREIIKARKTFCCFRKRQRLLAIHRFNAASDSVDSCGITIKRPLKDRVPNSFPIYPASGGLRHPTKLKATSRGPRATALLLAYVVWLHRALDISASCALWVCIASRQTCLNREVIPYTILSSLRKKRFAACRLRRLCARTSSVAPCWSTARYLSAS